MLYTRSLHWYLCPLFSDFEPRHLGKPGGTLGFINREKLYVVNQGGTFGCVSSMESDIFGILPNSGGDNVLRAFVFNEVVTKFDDVATKMLRS